jgi:hypothetical protein
VDTVFVLNVLAQMSAIVFVLMVILVLAWRRPAIARTPGLLPRAVAFGGAFSITGLAFFEPVAHSALVSGVSLGLICAGYAFACYSLLHLGRSLSLMAEARKLVTSGPMPGSATRSTLPMASHRSASCFSTFPPSPLLCGQSISGCNFGACITKKPCCEKTFPNMMLMPDASLALCRSFIECA